MTFLLCHFVSFYFIFCYFLCCTVNNYVKCSSNEDCPKFKDKPLECHNDTVRPACWCRGSRLSLYLQQDGGTCLGLYVNLSCHYEAPPCISPSKYKPPKPVTQKTLRQIAPPNISPRGLVLGKLPSNRK